MTQEIEIEFKTVLDRETFDRLLSALPFPKEAIEQTNYYFETNDFALGEKNSAIRIRKKGDNYILTLKQPHSEGLLETHEAIDKVEFMNWIEEKPVVRGKLKEELEGLQVDANKFVYFGYLTTFRRSFMQDGLEFVLDESHYNGLVDYELEIEAPTYEAGKLAFDNLLENYAIDGKDPITKNERFFKSLPQFLVEDLDEDE